MKHQDPDCTNEAIGEWKCQKCFDYQNVSFHTAKFRRCLLCKIDIAKKDWEKHLPLCEKKFISKNGKEKIQ